MSNNNQSAQKYQDQNNIEYRGDGLEVETGFEDCLTNKFNLFKTMITKALLCKNPALKLTQEEAKRVVQYTQESYFKHLRLYEFVFNNKQGSELKKINFIQP